MRLVILVCCDAHWHSERENMDRSYLIISPCRNESKYMCNMLEFVLNQSEESYKKDGIFDCSIIGTSSLIVGTGRYYVKHTMSLKPSP